MRASPAPGQSRKWCEQMRKWRCAPLCPKTAKLLRYCLPVWPQLAPFQHLPSGIRSAVIGTGTEVRFAVTRALSSDRRWPLRREDLLKPDGMSEAILLAAGTVIFLILLLILLVVLTRSAVPV
jgi:hypothetical protein